MNFERFDYWVAEKWLPYLIDNDPSSLTDEEYGQIKEWESQFSMYSPVFETTDKICELCTDEVTGLKAKCILVKMFMPKELLYL